MEDYRVAYKHINLCSFQCWYPLFRDIQQQQPQGEGRRRRQLTMASRWMTLPPEFVAYLLDEGTIRLPANLAEEIRTGDNVEDVGDSDENAWEEEEEQEGHHHGDDEREDFAEVQRFIRECMELYGGAVFPKLNWSSPKDAVYMVPHGSTRCTSLSDVFLLLKSSDFVTHDLERAYEDAQKEADDVKEPPILVLRGHYDIQTATEFRCFVRRNQLVAMCQRDCTNFYPLVSAKRDHFESLVVDFWEDHVRDRFPLQDYVVDLYVTRKDVVWVVDFNVYGPPTQSLMFEWEELEELAQAESIVPHLRVVEDQKSVPIRPTLSMYSGLPTDLVDVSNAEKISQWIREQAQIGKQ